MERALSFGAVAEAYERHRPGYPAEIVTLIVAPAIGQVSRAIEIGGGTGKATRVVAAAGIEVVASEPDEAMLGVLARECAGLPVQPVCAALEDLDVRATGTFDLLYAATAWHWTDPATRWDRAAALVRPGGALAFFGGQLELADERLVEVETQVRSRFLPSSSGFPSPSQSANGLDWPSDELLADERFEDVRQQQLPRRVMLPRDDYLAHLGTRSGYLMLAEADREQVFRELGAALPETLELSADLAVHAARRTSASRA